MNIAKVTDDIIDDGVVNQLGEVVEEFIVKKVKEEEGFEIMVAKKKGKEKDYWVIKKIRKINGENIVEEKKYKSWSEVKYSWDFIYYVKYAENNSKIDAQNKCAKAPVKSRARIVSNVSDVSDSVVNFCEWINTDES